MKAKKFFIETLGCPKNIADSENIIFSLEKTNFLKRTQNPNDADVIIINTCCFIQPAKQETFQTISKLSKFKKNKCKLLVVCGCFATLRLNSLSTVMPDKFKDQFPQVNLWIKLSEYPFLPQTIISNLFNNNNKFKFYQDKATTYLTPKSWAYLKIADGCNRSCSFCIIPKIKGPYRSRKFNSIINEAEKLVSSGVKELILISQDTANYGVDIYKKKTLVYLLNRLCKIKNLKWIRLMYLNPDGVTGELIDAIAAQDKICKYLDIPLQHSQKHILRRMGRGGDYQSLVCLVKKIRRKIKDVTIRTTLMVGFPGETDKDFQKLLNFLTELKFDKLGAFAYFPETGAKACKFKNQIPKKIKQFRYKQLLAAQQKISLEINSKLINKEFEVLIEEKITPFGVFKYVGRTYRDAPEIDGLFFITKGNASKGSFLKVKVADFTHYDLIGERC